MFLYWKTENLIQFLLTFLLFYNQNPRGEELWREFFWDPRPFPHKRPAGASTCPKPSFSSKEIRQ